MANKKEFFVTCRLAREDLEQAGYDASNVSDETMQSIADAIGESNMEGFWIDLPIHADNHHIHKHDFSYVPTHEGFHPDEVGYVGKCTKCGKVRKEITG